MSVSVLLVSLFCSPIKGRYTALRHENMNMPNGTVNKICLYHMTVYFIVQENYIQKCVHNALL